MAIRAEARKIPFSQALWINAMLRGIYPSSCRQIKTGRTQNRLALVRDTGNDRQLIVEE